MTTETQERKQTLIELSYRIRHIIDAHTDAETGELVSDFSGALEQAMTDATERLDGCAFYRNLKLSEADALDKEIELLRKAKRQKESEAERLEKYMADCMRIGGVKKHEGRYRVTLCQGKESVVIFDETKIPNHYKTEVITTKIDKAAIGKNLKSGMEIDGAVLERGDDYLLIK